MARTRPLTAVEVESEIMRLMDLLEARTEEFAEAAQHAARMESHHKATYARAFLMAEGNMTIREHVATQNTVDAYTQRKIAEASYQSTKESLLTLRAQLDALRSIGANIRSQT